MTESISDDPALLIDLDGVIYLDNAAIDGALETMEWIRTQGIPYLYITNTTSRDRQSLVDKLDGLGITVSASQIFTPIIAARNWLAAQDIRRIAPFVARLAVNDFEGVEVLDPSAETGAEAVVIGDMGAGWDFQTLNRAFRLLMDQPEVQLIALGMTRYWRAADGLRLDVAPFVKALEYASDSHAVVIGKPSAAYFSAALDLLGVTPGNAIMIGDDINADCRGAQDAGIRSVLVKTGKFRELDLESGALPDGVIESIAEFPSWMTTRLSQK